MINENLYSVGNPADEALNDPHNDPFNTSFDEDNLDDYFSQLAEQEAAYQADLLREHQQSSQSQTSAPDPDQTPTVTSDAATASAVEAPSQQSSEQQSLSDAIQAELDRKFNESMRQEIEPYEIRATDEIPPLKPILSRNKAILCSEGNISAVVGEAKSKKTFLCTAMIGSLLDITRKELFGIKGERCRVLWVDTEQSPAHIQKVLFRINVLGELAPATFDPTLRMLQLREKSPKDRYTALQYAIAVYQPKLVVVDGVSDLMCDTNNLQSSEALVSDLLALATAASCHIICVLHANPNSDKARGHLGSTLMRKSETVMFVHKTGDVSVVEPQYCRNVDFERFAFKVEEIEGAEYMDKECQGLGIPVECELPTEVDIDSDNQCVRILQEAFGGVAERKLLTSKIESVLGTTASNSRVMVSRAIKRGLLQVKNKVVSIVRE